MKVAFLGLGIMGSRQAAHLTDHDLTVWTRTSEKAAAWADQRGARAAATPREAARDAEVVISMVVDGEQVREVLLGDDGAAHGAPEGALFLDMTTIAPAQVRSIAEGLTARGMRMVDAPVTGSSPRAEAGTLTIMCGGERGDVEQARPLLEAMGGLIVHAGPLGHGQIVKLINNAVAAINAATVAQAFVAARGLGADLTVLSEVMAAGSGGSAMLDLKGPPMRAHDYSTLFKLEHMLKDLRLCLEETQQAGVPFPSAAAARDLYAAGMGRGLGDADFASVLEVVESLAGVRI